VGQPAVAQKVVNGADRARFLVPSAENQPRHACGENCSRAHGTRFESDHKRHVIETPRPEVGGGIAQGQHFGMSRGVARLLATVATSPDHGAVFVDHNGTHGNIFRVSRRARLGEREFHPRVFS